uniref:Germane domain-containing protein n=1 Tax=Rhabditophanes sp. KR3021 TaxID=114890 RepID=A0AC35UDQ5_9BILA
MQFFTLIALLGFASSAYACAATTTVPSPTTVKARKRRDVQDEQVVAVFATKVDQKDTIGSMSDLIKAEFSSVISQSRVSMSDLGPLVTQNKPINNKVGTIFKFDSAGEYCSEMIGAIGTMLKSNLLVESVSITCGREKTITISV